MMTELKNVSIALADLALKAQNTRSEDDLDDIAESLTGLRRSLDMIEECLNHRKESFTNEAIRDLFSAFV